MVHRSSGYDPFTEIFAASQHFGLFLAGRFACGHCEGIQLGRSIDAFSICEEAFDSQNLNFWIIFVVPELRCESPGRGGFVADIGFGFIQLDAEIVATRILRQRSRTPYAQRDERLSGCYRWPRVAEDLCSEMRLVAVRYQSNQRRQVVECDR